MDKEGKIIQENKRVEWVKLTCLSGEIEADILFGFLKTNEIPAVKMYPGATQAMKIYMGTAIGVEIHVPEDMLLKAKEILKEMENQC